jgi:hypothetical protein
MSVKKKLEREKKGQEKYERTAKQAKKKTASQEMKGI